MYSFPNLKPVSCSMLVLDLHTDFSRGSSGVWHSHLFHNFPQFVVIHTLKGFGIVNKAEVDVFLELSCHKEVCKPPNPSLRPNPRHIPTLAPYVYGPKSPPTPTQVKSQGHFYLFSLPHVGAWATIKPCLDFLSCL